MINTVQTISTDQILCCREAMGRVLSNISRGKISYSGSTPLDVYFITEGPDKGRYLLINGHHRLFARLLLKKQETEVFIEEQGLKSDCLYSIKQDFAIDLSLPYCGLETLTDPKTLDGLYNFL